MIMSAKWKNKMAKKTKITYITPRAPLWLGVANGYYFSNVRMQQPTNAREAKSAPITPNPP